MNTWFVDISDSNAYLSSPENFYIIECDSVRMGFSSDERFGNDQYFGLYDERLLIQDGVILNLHELREKYTVSSIPVLFSKIEESTGHHYFEKLIGPFCGAIYNKKNKETIVYSNQTGDATAFYYHAQDQFVASNDLNMLVGVLKERHVPIHFDESAAFCLLTFGYMIDDSTFLQEIKRVPPGSYVLYENHKTKTTPYYEYKNVPTIFDIDTAVEKVDQAFQMAVRRCFEKDIEYGYHHLADLSGGLDSRMTCWVAKYLGYKDIQCISYSQSQSDEYKYTREVSIALKTPLLYKQLDDALFMMEAEQLVKLNYGLAPYFGITGGKALLESVNFDYFGLEHTGQLGDVILGAYTEQDLPVHTPAKRYSNLLSLDNKIPGLKISQRRYDNLEDFLMNTRGFNGMLSTHLIRRHYTYAVSPFLDPEFMDVCKSISLDLRRDHKLYWEWIHRKYPEASSIKSTRGGYNTKITNAVKETIRKSDRILHEIAYRLSLAKSRIPANNMNPIQFWYDTKTEIQTYVNAQYQQHLSLLQKYPLIHESIGKMLQSSRAIDKFLGVSVIATVAQYFGDGIDEKNTKQT